MQEIDDYRLPIARDRFKPRNEQMLLSAIVHHAGMRYAAELFPETDRAHVAAVVKEHIAARSNESDLAVLRRYGFTETIERMSVLIYNPTSQRYDERVSVELPEPIEVPRNGASATACAPRYSEWPDNGISDKYRAELVAEGKLAEFLADQVAREASFLPRELDGYFARIIEGRAWQRGAYSEASEWPASYRAEHGKWPTWAEIEERYPFVGAYLAARRAACREAA